MKRDSIRAKERAIERFWDQVRLVGAGPTDCWMWGGLMRRDGYGRAWTGVGSRRAHRVAYELTVGPIPRGLELDHLCRNPGCVNPAHLEAVTHEENVRRGIRWNLSKTHCPSGHPYDEKNTRWYQGRRYCRACQDFWNAANRVRATRMAAAAREKP